MKNGLQVRPGGFFEIEFFWDNNRCFEEIIGNRPVLRGITRHYNTVGGANELVPNQATIWPNHDRRASDGVELQSLFTKLCSAFDRLMANGADGENIEVFLFVLSL